MEIFDLSWSVPLQNPPPHHHHHHSWHAKCWLKNGKVSQDWNWPLKTDQSFHSTAALSFTSSLSLPLCKRPLLSSIELSWPVFAFALDLCIVASVRWRGGKFSWACPSHPIWSPYLPLFERQSSIQLANLRNTSDFQRVQPKSLLLKCSWDPKAHWWFATYHMWICRRPF